MIWNLGTSANFGPLKTNFCLQDGLLYELRLANFLFWPGIDPEQIFLAQIDAWIRGYSVADWRHATMLNQRKRFKSSAA